MLDQRGGMNVLEELWVAKCNLIISPDYARIDFLGDGHDDEASDSTVVAGSNRHFRREPVVSQRDLNRPQALYQLHGRGDRQGMSCAQGAQRLLLGTSHG